MVHVSLRDTNKESAMANDIIREHNRATMQRLLNMRQVATALNVGRSTAFELTQSGQLRSVRIGKRRLVPVDALDEFLESLSAER
jgi:excisionase family DNA binding protein